ncbi:LysM peptidoglycan-binding domain-containing protein [Sinanaerobacter sp. ZZT-01]|uniref:LysM peptidoglycan-binding domain-containing protein n=1 Tax=Sinanaerobacter sp. ZZT-01 TaxID=3111540 RepID=UPI002D796CDE|nr:LysM peptidoglycan-binding domain-containing protein [Sinanaerobacter sp. ZZT-01]WRR93113.1 LysM peptidoglycan-binding domain-containing protein [Sinanaerobacter sp. ZZT-01]
MTKKYRIVSKTRFTIFMSLLFILLIILINSLSGLYQSNSLTRIDYTEIQIQAGDTLWKLAQEFGPSNQDLRAVIYEICMINQISADSIQPGQSILIPASI